LIYFGLAKAHIGLYIPSPILEEYRKELAGYESTKATLRIPINEDLPLELIKDR
jgi:uncharacterized protein YdhG (YjbR/CyaY superfamily)